MAGHFETTGFSDDTLMQRVVIEALQELAGNSIHVEPTTNLVQLERDLGDSLFHLELMMHVEEHLGLQMSFEEWAAFYRYRSLADSSASDSQQLYREWERDVVPALTVSALVDFIRERCVSVSFEPIRVLGSPPCAAAGYFVGMSELARQVRPDVERFGPSTPITQVLPAHSLRIFWRRLSRVAGRSLPQLSFWLNHLANVLLVASSLCLVMGVLVDWAFLAAVWLLCVKGILSGMWLHRRANPLPRGIVTFGDLARYLAKEQEPAAES